MPIQCVFVEEGTHYAYTATGGDPVKVTVEVGTSNDTYIEIASGLDEGDRVLLYNPTIQADPAAEMETGEEEEPAESSAASGVAGG